jgi:hypothetical protein
MSPLTSVLAVARPASSTPRGPTIDVFYNFDGGRSWTRRQHPLGGPTIDVPYNFIGGRCQTYQ